MPVGDCERAFAEASAQDGVVLVRAKVAWLNQRGHLGLPDAAAEVHESLDRIFTALDGDHIAQAAKRTTPLPGDFLHEPSGTFIEIDESQHFTSHRLETLRLYPSSVRLGYDIEDYVALCEIWAARSDRYFASKAAVGFGSGGRQRQRAYHDALRDLATPAMGHPPLIRVAAPDRDGSAAYLRVRDRLHDLVD